MKRKQTHASIASLQGAGRGTVKNGNPEGAAGTEGFRNGHADAGGKETNWVDSPKREPKGQLAESASDAAADAWLWFALSFPFVAAGVCWAYWPTLVELRNQWEKQPDYSHGYLVLPISLAFLISKRSSFPSGPLQVSWAGLFALLLATGLRVVAGRYYLASLDGWTFPLTLAAAAWLFYGWKVLKWSVPALAFMWFMVPIPFSAERWLSHELQFVATKLSTVVLVMLGQPAIPEGTTILLGEHSLFVEEACSGMRIFIGILALSFAFMLFMRWSLLRCVAVLFAILPLAIVANVTRIAVTGLLYQFVSSETGKAFSHDFAGYVMIPFAAGLLLLYIRYLDMLIPEVEELQHPAQVYRSSLGTEKGAG